MACCALTSDLEVEHTTMGRSTPTGAAPSALAMAEEDSPRDSTLRLPLAAVMEVPAPAPVATPVGDDAGMP